MLIYFKKEFISVKAKLIFLASLLQGHMVLLKSF